MRRVITAAIAAAFLISGAAVASAGENQQLTVDPDSGPAGTTYTVSGEDCAPPIRAVGLQASPSRVVVSAESSSPSPQEVAPDEAGDWTAEFTVDADTPPGELTIEAQCQELVFQENATFFQQPEPEYEREFDYDNGTFTVTESQTEPTDPPATPTSEPPDTLPDATPAPAVVARPTFTG